MDTVTVNRFRDHLTEHLEKVLKDHAPLKVTGPAGDAFIVVGADDWERDRETLYVLQNRSLMDQIVASAATHAASAPTRSGRPASCESAPRPDCRAPVRNSGR